MKRVLAALLMMTALLFLSQKAESEQLRIGTNLRQEKILLPSAAPDKSRLVLLESERLEDEKIHFGILVFYDDPRTKLKIDYIEFYDVAGNLLLVSWIDRFGICEIAIDRGLLDEKHPGIEGVLVALPSGTNL